MGCPSLRILGHWVLLKLDRSIEKSEGGIVFASAYRLPASSGRVEGVGSRAKLLGISPDDRVSFNWIDATQTGKEIEWPPGSGQRLNFVRADAIKFIVEPQTKVEGTDR
jgi:co-chaperonin GroES (HSP10)